MTRRLSSITHLVLIAIAAGLLLAGAFAAAQSKATVNIPFAFTVNHQTIPPGYYALELLSDRFSASPTAVPGGTKPSSWCNLNPGSTSKHAEWCASW